jgi:hypothetical protein
MTMKQGKESEQKRQDRKIYLEALKVIRLKEKGEDIFDVYRKTDEDIILYNLHMTHVWTWSLVQKIFSIKDIPKNIFFTNDEPSLTLKPEQGASLDSTGDVSDLVIETNQPKGLDYIQGNMLELLYKVRTNHTSLGGDPISVDFTINPLESFPEYGECRYINNIRYLSLKKAADSAGVAAKNLSNLLTDLFNVKYFPEEHVHSCSNKDRKRSYGIEFVNCIYSIDDMVKSSNIHKGKFRAFMRKRIEFLSECRFFAGNRFTSILEHSPAPLPIDSHLSVLTSEY